jgi:hypothetical protein
MTLPRTAAEVLARHVTLEVECIDRMYLNVFQPRLQHVEGVVQFLRSHRGYPIASSALLEPISREFLTRLYRFAAEGHIPVIDFAKDQRKDDLAQAFLAEFDRDEGVLFIGRAQEKATVFRTEKRRNPITGVTYPWIVKTAAMVNHYAVDGDFGDLHQVLLLLSLQRQALHQRQRIRPVVGSWPVLPTGRFPG